MKKSKFKNGIILDELRMVYWYIPKAACTTLKIFFAERCNLKWNGVQEDVHAYCWHHWEKRDELMKGYHNFAIVRDPIFRIISLYVEKICDSFSDNVFGRFDKFYQNMPFEKFVQMIVEIEKPDFHWTKQALLIPEGVELYGMDNLFLRALKPYNTTQSIKSIGVHHNMKPETKELLLNYYEEDYELMSDHKII